MNVIMREQFNREQHYQAIKNRDPFFIVATANGVYFVCHTYGGPHSQHKGLRPAEKELKRLQLRRGNCYAQLVAVLT